jgi:hypothetical protein
LSWEAAPYLMLVRSDWPLLSSNSIHGIELLADGLVNLAGIWKEQ